MDELFYKDIHANALIEPPGRLAPITATCLVFLTISYSLLHLMKRPSYRWAQVLCLVTILICFQALVGYLLGHQTTFGISPHTRIAIHTAISLILIACTFLLQTAHHGYMKLFLNNSPSVQNMKVLIAMVVLAPPVLNSIDRLGQRWGLFNADFGVLFRIMTFVTVFVVLIWRNANRLHLMEQKNKRTDRRLLHREIERQRRLMEQKVILEAGQKAIDSSRFKSEFLANVSHEVRTPLNGIIGMTALLSRTQLNEKQREFLKTIDVSSQSLLALINQILDISKIESGHISIEKSIFELDALLNTVVSIISFSAEQKGLPISVEIDPAVPMTLIGDPLRVQQVLLNLLNNAVKFSEKGQVTLRVCRLPNVNSTPYFLFEVIDHGVGIDDHVRSKLFKAFSQGDPTTSRKYGGTGLGLAISKQLVELMGGSISMESKKDQGSRFYFELPLEISRFKPQIFPHHLSLVPSPAGRVLIVEDIRVNQQIAIEMLKLIGCEAVTVSSGKEALEIMQKERFDLILMDVQMPEMEGYEVSERIRNGEAGVIHKRTPIIAITASALNNENEKCLKSGMNDFIAKPVEITDFTRKVNKWLTEGKSVLNRSTMQTLNALSQKTNVDLIRQLADLFSKEIPLLIEELRTSVNQGDFKAASRIAHAIKSSSGSMGARRMQDLSEQIECSPSKTPASITMMVDALEKEYRLAIQELQKQKVREM